MPSPARGVAPAPLVAVVDPAERFAAIFDRHLRASGYTERTRAEYLRVVKVWARAGTPDPNTWLARVQDGSKAHGLPTRSAGRAVFALRALWSALGRDGTSIRTPQVVRYRSPKRAKVLTADELARVQAALRDPHLDPRIAIAGAVMLGAGLRVAEAAALRLSDLRPGDGGVHITVREGKGRRLTAGDAPETVWAPAWAAALLAGYLRAARPRYAGGGAWLLPSRAAPGHPLTPRAIRRGITAVGDAAGVPGLHPHALRHALATALAAAGVERVHIKAALRHRDSSTTGRYVHLGSDTLARVRNAAGV